MYIIFRIPSVFSVLSGTLHIPRCSNNKTSKWLPFMKQPYFESFHQDLTETAGTKAQLGKNHCPSPFKFAFFFSPFVFSWYSGQGKSKGEFCAIPQVNKMKTLPTNRTRRSDLQHAENKPQLYHRTIFSYMAQSSYGVSSPPGSSFSPTVCSPVFFPLFYRITWPSLSNPIPALPSPHTDGSDATGCPAPNPEIEGEVFKHATRDSAGWGGC